MMASLRVLCIVLVVQTALIINGVWSAQPSKLKPSGKTDMEHQIFPLKDREFEKSTGNFPDFSELPSPDDEEIILNDLHDKPIFLDEEHDGVDEQAMFEKRPKLSWKRRLAWKRGKLSW